ncbi:MAG: hypothetical protein GC136_04600 [Alphaproteobacteria bacterium]|nr:hypothetical protein [Alphaproteobacteria bacterium]
MTITSITLYEVPEGNADDFVHSLRENIQLMRLQPGMINGHIYHVESKNSYFKFVNVTHWESEAAMDAALAKLEDTLEDCDIDREEEWRELGVHITPVVCSTEMAYEGKKAA